MARIRTIKPEFWTDAALMECSVSARLLFIGMWNFADDNGNIDRSAKQIKARVFPADSIDCEPLIHSLLENGLLCEYAVDGKKYLHIQNFRKHQVINRPSKSHIPLHVQSLNTHGGLTEDSRTEGKGREGKETTPATSRDTQPDSGQPAAGVAPGDSTTPPNPTPPATEPDAPPTPKPGRFDASLAALRNTPPTGTPDHERAGELWAVLAANSCKGTPQHPAVLEMVRAGVTPDQLRAAIAEARKSNGATLNPAYLAAIVDRIRTQPPKDPTTADWATSEDAATAKGRELGINPRAGESWPEFRGRIREALANTARASVR